MMIIWGFFVVKDLGFLEQTCGLFLWKFGLIFRSVFFAFLMTLAYVGVSGVITTNLCKCEYVLLHTKCLISCLYEDFGFDSLFLICFKSGGFNVSKFSNNLG